MKRALVCLLAAVLALTMTACGKGSSQDRPALEGERGPASAPSEATEITTETEVSAEEAVGVFSDGVYANEMLGVQAAFDEESWYVASAEERMELIGIMADEITDDAIAQNLQDTGSAMDLYAVQANGSSVNIMLQKVNFLQGALISEDQYLAASEEQMPEALAAIQVEDTEVEKATAFFAGQAHPALKISGVQGGMDFHEKLVVVKAGGYFGVVTAACYGEDVTDSILALFTEK